MGSFLVNRLVRAARFMRRYSTVLLVLLTFFSMRCSSSSDGGSGGTGGDGDTDPDDGREDIDLHWSFSRGGASGSSLPLNPLCGEGECVPDDRRACSSLGGAGGMGGGPALGGLGGLGGSIMFDPGDLDDYGSSCQVRRESDCEGTDCNLERGCGRAGPSDVGQPCVSAADCRPGLACVGQGVSGLCRPYCCRGTQRACAEGTFCDERSLPDAPEIYVPVCIPVDDCHLSDPFPCPDGQDCACSDERACVVVRTDGATACTVPGAGRTGDPCTGMETAECAHGFVCHPTAGCMQLCSTVAQQSQCPEEANCQSPSDFPADLGVCVTGDAGPTAAR